MQGRIQDLAMGGAKICREASSIYERSELRAKRVQISWGYGIFFEFRTPESESERNLTNYFIIFLLLFY